MGIGPLQGQRPQHALERFTSPLDIARQLSACARSRWACVVGFVGVEPLLDCAARHPKRFPPGSGLDRFQVAVIDAPLPYEPFDFRADLGLDRGLEPFFSAAPLEAASGVSSSASAHRSHACQYASTS